VMRAKLDACDQFVLTIFLWKVILTRKTYIHHVRPLSSITRVSRKFAAGTASLRGDWIRLSYRPRRRSSSRCSVGRRAVWTTRMCESELRVAVDSKCGPGPPEL
jgi:hypothetical protein